MVMKLTSLTAVFIARDFCASFETVRALADALAERVVDVNIIIVANGAGSVTPMICSSANLLRFVVRSFLRSGFYKALEEIQGPHYPARPSQTKILTGSPSRSRPPRLFRCSNISGQLPVRR